jgi:hypothetical protein
LEQPEGFVEGANKVCRLNKSLYGLKQSGRNWYMHLSDHLKVQGMVASPHDPCLFTKAGLYACIWVDDIIYAGKSEGECTQFLASVKQQFKVGDNGKLEWFLGMRFERTEKELVVSQQAYVERVLKKFGMSECKPVTTPLAENICLSRDSCPEEGSPEQREMRNYDYRGLVGSLIYLSTSTRPDLAFCTHLLSSFLNNPGIEHWSAAKRVLRYLKGTMLYKLRFQTGGDTKIIVTGNCDSDFAGRLDSRKSTTGYCFSIVEGGTVVSWSSKLQSTVATSTTEAEVTAAVEACKEAHCLKGLLSSMLVESGDVQLYCDNQAAIALSKNPVNQPKTKHYAVRVSYLRERCSEDVRLVYVPTDDNRADLLTKGLGKIKTELFMKKLTHEDKREYQVSQVSSESESALQVCGMNRHA